MPISLNDIANLKDSSSYYLSDKGEIKKQGIWTTFKCLFDIGHSRQRVQNLANEIQRVILEASGQNQSDSLARDLQSHGLELGLTGAELKETLRKYQTPNIDNFINKEAKNLTNEIINEAKNKLFSIENADNFFPDKDKILSLMNHALTPIIKNPPTKIEDGKKLLNSDAFSTAAKNALNDLSSILKEIIKSEKLGKPVINSAYCTYLKNILYTSTGERKQTTINDLKEPKEAFADHIKSLFSEEEQKEPVKKIIDTLLPHILKLNKDVQGIIFENFKNLVTKEDNSIHDVETVKNIFNGFANNIKECKNFKDTNPLLYKKICSTLSTSPEPFPSGTLTKIIQSAEGMPLNFAKNLPEKPTPMELHKAVFQIVNAKNTLIKQFINDFAGSGENEKKLANDIVTSVLLSNFSEKERINFMKALAHRSASATLQTYAELGEKINVLDLLDEDKDNDQKKIRMEIAIDCKATLKKIQETLYSFSNNDSFAPIPDYLGSINSIKSRILSDIDNHVTSANHGNIDD